MESVTLSLPEAYDLALEVLSANGFSADHAAAIARNVTAGERDGCASHGLWPLSRRQRRFVDRRPGGAEGKLLTIKIITILDLPAQVDVMLLLLKVKGESLISRHEVRAPRRVE